MLINRFCLVWVVTGSVHDIDYTLSPSAAVAWTHDRVLQGDMTRATFVGRSAVKNHAQWYVKKNLNFTYTTILLDVPRSGQRTASFVKHHHWSG
jgi:hypothetical protein